MPLSTTRATDDYRSWRNAPVTVAGRSYLVATKPGVLLHGHADPAAVLMAERIPIANGDVVVHLNCANGLFGAVAAAKGAARIVVADRNIVAVEAARRTLEANDVAVGDALLGHGAPALPPGLKADVVAIRIPQEKVSLLRLLVDAFDILKVGGRCYLAGATNEGAKTATRTMEALFGNAGTLAHDSGHRLAAAVKRTESPATADGLDNPYLPHDVFRSLDSAVRDQSFRLFSRPGVFSWDHLDEASALLANEMTVNVGDAVLDLGCGSGILGVVAATLSGTGRVQMVDADVEAVRSARHSAAAAGIENATALTSDITAGVNRECFDVVVTNPPFHVGKTTDLNVPLQFIQESWEVLGGGGRMYLVANRTLPYERTIKQRFGNITTVHDGRRFKVLSAMKSGA